MSSPARLILCPQCKNSFPVTSGFLSACPRCGKVVQLPAPETPPTPSPPAIPAEHQATIPVNCKLCGSRYYAKAREIGRNLACPDCHTENFVVPQPVKRAPAGPGPAPAPTSATGLPASFEPPPKSDQPPADDDDEFRLSEPVESPRYQLLSPESSHLESYLEKPNAAAERAVPQPPPVPPTPAAARPATPMPASPASRSRPQENTTPVPPPPPPPPPRSAGSTGGNSGPSTFFSQKSLYDGPAVKPDEKKSSTAHEIAQVRGTRREAAADLWAWMERHPFSLGLLPALSQPQVLARWLSAAFLMSGQLIMVWIASSYHFSEDETDQMLGVPMLLLTIFTMLPSLIALSSFSLTVFEDTANGNEHISSWPEFNFVEWAMGSVILVAALGISGLPGIMVGLFMYGYESATITNTLLLTVPTLVFSWYAFFPIVFISMQETGSVMEPFSAALFHNAGALKFRWTAFYVATLLLVLALALVVPVLLYMAYASNYFTLAVATLVPCGILLSGFPLVYLRFLGKMAMIYRDHLATLEDGSSSEEEPELDIQTQAIRSPMMRKPTK